MIFLKIWFFIFFINLTYIVLFQKQAKPQLERALSESPELGEFGKIVAILITCAFCIFGPIYLTYKLIVYKNPFHEKNS